MKKHANCLDGAEFRNPGAGWRPLAFWAWNDDLKPGELRRQMREMKAKGWGGFFMHSRGGLITPYLSGAWHEAARASVELAAQLGLEAWIYDEDRWPSGFAGGLVPALGSEYCAKGLVVRRGPHDAATDTVIRPGKGPARGMDFVMRTRPCDGPYGENLGYVDWLNPDTIRQFFKITVDGYERHSGKFFGGVVPGVFFDEPIVLDLYGMAEIAMPWTSTFPEDFEKQHGYSILPHLEKLFFQGSGQHRIRYDFFATVTALYVERFTRAYQRLSHKKKLLFTGHYNFEEDAGAVPINSGAVMPHYEFMDWPGIDKLRRNTCGDLTCKQASSVADQVGKERVMSEVFGCCGQQFDFAGRRWIHNWQAALGVNAMVPHLSLYSMCGERKRDYPPNFFYQQPWWPYERGLSDYFGRVNYALTRGRRVCDVLVMHPAYSGWALYDPSNMKDWWDVVGAAAAMKPYQDHFKEVTSVLLGHRLDFHYGDESILRRHGSLTAKALKVGLFSYGYVVVPSAFTWQSETLSLLKRFHDRGGTVIFTGTPAALEDAKMKVDCRKLFRRAHFVRTPSEAAALLLAVKGDVIRVVNRKTGRNAAKVYVHERELDDGRRLVFLTNTAEHDPVHARVTLPYLGRIEQWSLENGKSSPVDACIGTGGMEISATLHPGEAVLWAVDRKGSVPVLRVNPPREKASRLSRWIVEPLDDNVLPVERARVCWPGLDTKTPWDLNRLWDDFFKLPEGAIFSAEYEFTVDNIPAGRLFAAIERADHLDRITINGVEVEVSDQWWCDRLFKKVSLTGRIKRGVNRLRIEGRKFNINTNSRRSRKLTDGEYAGYRETELEPVYIVGAFSVRDRGQGRYQVTQPRVTRPLRMGDVGSQGWPFAVGRFSCRSEFVWGGAGKCFVDLKGVEAPCVEVKVNGRRAGVLYWAPYRVEVTRLARKGKNRIELIFPTDLFNAFGPANPKVGLPDIVEPKTFRTPQPSARIVLPRGIDGASIVFLSASGAPGSAPGSVPNIDLFT